NGLCSSITEFEHIKAVKRPMATFKQTGALGQILLINQCLDKLATYHVDLESQGI
ncbi:hypothetical protein DFJ43DRAFT_966050, partial [Lentinula guzmanii]